MLRWLESLRESESDLRHFERFKPMLVRARAMCCSLGFTAPAAVAALNARVNHFTESRFVGQGGRRIMAAQLHGVSVWGAARLDMMLESVLTEIRASRRLCVEDELSLLICCAEAQRPGIDRQSLREHFLTFAQSHRFHSSSAVLSVGRGGIAQALLHASELLHRGVAAGRPRAVLLVGVDSLLVAASIEHLLAQDRLLTHTNSDGLIPAEGAAALLLEPATPSTAEEAQALCITAVAQATDTWQFGSDSPARATGLTQAVRQVLTAIHGSLADMDFHISGGNGEAWYSREVALMQSRCMQRKRESFPHLQPSLQLGDAPAAAPVQAIAWMADMMTRIDPTHSPGRLALAHFCGDDDQRSAIVLRGPAQPSQPQTN